MYKKLLAFLFVLGFLVPSVVFAHAGRTNSEGCHTVKKTGDYHCHSNNNEIKQAKTSARTEVKTLAKSNREDIVCSSDFYNCSDFKFQSEAQKVFEYCGINDIHQLDRDKDSLACEELE